jgi:hypothetical protein
VQKKKKKMACSSSLDVILSSLSCDKSELRIHFPESKANGASKSNLRCGWTMLCSEQTPSLSLSDEDESYGLLGTESNVHLSALLADVDEKVALRFEYGLHEFTIEQFRSWASIQCERRLGYDELFRARSALADVQRMHLAEMETLRERRESVRMQWEESDDRLAIESAEKRLTSAQRGVAGMLEFVGELDQMLHSKPLTSSEHLVSSDQLASSSSNEQSQRNREYPLQKKITPRLKKLMALDAAELAARRDVVQRKLDARREEMATVQCELDALRLASPAYVAHDEMCAAYEAFKERVGIAAAYERIDAASKGVGNRSSSVGVRFEALAVELLRVVALPDMEARERERVGRSNFRLEILTNVMLQCAAAELDGVVVAIDDDAECVDGAPVVRAIAIVEMKRNIADIGKAFRRFKATLDFFCGVDGEHSALYRNTSYPCGVFDVDAVHRERDTGAAYVFHPAHSFERFATTTTRSSADGDHTYIDGVYFMTRASLLRRLNSREESSLLRAVSTEPRIDCTRPADAPLELYADILERARGKIARETSTEDVARLYLETNHSHQFLFVVHSRDSRQRMLNRFASN